MGFEGLKVTAFTELDSSVEALELGQLDVVLF
jgi:hypothetical protein